MLRSGDNRSAHASELELHRLALDQLPPEQRGAVEAHARACPSCAEALASLRSAQEVFDRDVHPRTAPALAERAQGTPAARRWALWLGMMAVPAAALVMLGLGLGDGLLGTGPAVRPKGPTDPEGQPGLDLFVRRGEVVFALPPGGEVRAQDALRFVVRRPAGMDHLLVAGVDGAGRVTVYHPWGQTASAPLGDGPRRIELAGSIVLDDSTGPERVFALFARRPYDLSAVVPALKAAAAGGPAGLRQGRPAFAAAVVDGHSSVLIERAGPR